MDSWFTHKPPKPPPSPTTRTIGVIVRDAANENVNGARVTLWTGQIVEGITTYGLATLTIPVGLADTQMGVYAEGYHDVDAHLNVAGGIGQVWVGGASEPGCGVICLPPMRAVYVPPPPSPRPTRERVMRVCADFAFNETDGGNSKYQSYAYAGWSDNERAAARELWHRIGMTHVAISFALTYANAAADFDFRSNPEAFRLRLKELRDDGFIIVLAACQEECYGKYGGYDLAANLRDISRWAEWGWTPYIDLVWPGWESNDFLWFSELRAVLRHLRTTLGPEQVIAVQPGRGPTEGYIWSDDGPETATTMPGDPREYFWKAMHALDIKLDLFFAEPATVVFEAPNWREKLYDELMGMSARIYQRIDPVPERFPFPPFNRTDEYHENWTRCLPIDGGGVPLVYGEGPAYLRWLSSQKSEASRIALLVPGVIGVGDGIAEVPR